MRCCDEIPVGTDGSVPSFGSTSIADIRNTSGRPSLCGYLHAAGGGAFGQERRSLGGQLSLRGRERRGALKPETRNSGGEPPRKLENNK
ncbi:hypothetical protein Zmor_005771 [Zophobas morio]|uniref:Uncharacterized protein n=1 Tax=Zophobas morio TaxID=2755281 RepID=A0AA38MMI7_9CUCU|nr:hypothetical protein Zmor_005771 [Zophobas morio]